MSSEDPKYLKMLAQMGLTPDIVPDDMKQSILDKLGISKKSKPESASANKEANRKSKKERVKGKKSKELALAEREEAAKLAMTTESDLHMVSNPNDKLTLNDLFNSINTEGETGPINTTKLRKQFKSLDKEAQKAPALQAPVSGRKRKRQEMEANYNINQKNLGKFIQQVKRGREEAQSDFTTSDKILHGGGVALNSIAQIAANRENSSTSVFTASLEYAV
jgi:hypothetical protein